MAALRQHRRGSAVVVALVAVCMAQALNQVAATCNAVDAFGTPFTGFAGLGGQVLDGPLATAAKSCYTTTNGVSVIGGWAVTYLGEALCCTGRGRLTGAGTCATGCDLSIENFADFFFAPGAVPGDYGYLTCFSDPAELCLPESTATGDAVQLGRLFASPTLNPTVRREGVVETASSFDGAYAIQIGSPMAPETVYCTGRGSFDSSLGTSGACRINTCDVGVNDFIVVANPPIETGVDCYFNCYGAAPHASACLTQGERLAVAEAFAATVAPEYSVQNGQFNFFDISLCAANPTCFLQNADEPYGFFVLPKAPTEPVHNASLNPSVILPNTSWRLRSDEAIVIFGCNPPQARYLALTPYVVDRWNGTAWLKIFGSLDDSINHLRMQTFNFAGDLTNNAYTSNQVTIMAADVNVFQDMRAAFLAAGVPEVNWMRIPAGGWGIPGLPGGVTMGLSQFDDTFSILFRLAIVQDPVAFQSYKISSPFTVLRVSRRDIAPPRPSNLYSPVSLIPRATPNNEVGLTDARDALVAAVIAKYNIRFSSTIFPGVANVLGAEVDFGGVCYVLGVGCSGDNRDARYGATQGTIQFFQPTDFNVLVGTNHVATGMAEYSNIVDYNAVRQVGVVGVTNDQYAGSANSYLAGTEYEQDADYFFAYKFARTCAGGESFCAVVPSAGFPSIPPFNPMMPNAAAALFGTRAYVHPFSQVGPAAGSLLTPVHIRFQRRPCQACIGQFNDATDNNAVFTPIADLNANGVFLTSNPLDVDVAVGRNTNSDAEGDRVSFSNLVAAGVVAENEHTPFVLTITSTGSVTFNLTDADDGVLDYGFGPSQSALVPSNSLAFTTFSRADFTITSVYLPASNVELLGSPLNVGDATDAGISGVTWFVVHPNITQGVSVFGTFRLGAFNEANVSNGHARIQLGTYACQQDLSTNFC